MADNLNRKGNQTIVELKVEAFWERLWLGKATDNPNTLLLLIQP